jgi:L-histidine Nalpha-methyltransferase
MRMDSMTEFAQLVRAGLTRDGQKTLPTKYLYDALGSALFDAITLVPEYGLTRAEFRLLGTHAADIAEACGPETTQIAELGGGYGTKARLLLGALGASTAYRPIDVSRAALDTCSKELCAWQVEPVEADYLKGLATVSRTRREGSMLVLFLGSNIGNFVRDCIPEFLAGVRATMSRGDSLLIGADLIKPVPQLIEAYDDPAGVNAAFNKNLLARLNKELEADFDLRCFDHEIRWNADTRAIEMHLRARSDQYVSVRACNLRVTFRAGETIHTESSHKFTPDELIADAAGAGFTIIDTWQDRTWPFAEILLRAE